MNTSARTDRAFLPSDLSVTNSLIRAAVCRALAAVNRGSPTEILRRNWPTDRAASEVLNRAAVDPASTQGWGSDLVASAVGAFVSGLAPASAASRLIASGMRIDLTGLGRVTIPRLASGPTMAVVNESEPIPVYQPSIDASATLGPAAKVAGICTLSDELLGATAGNAEAAIGAVLRESAAAALDGLILTDAAGGVLNSVAPIAASSSTDAAAMIDDMTALAAAVVVGGGSTIWLVTSPSRALRLRLLAGAGLGDMPILTSRAVADNVLIAIDPGAFASGFTDAPEIDLSTQAIVHLDTAPQEIVDQGTAGTAAAVLSTWQTRTTSLRLILRFAFTMRAPAIAWAEGVAW